MKKIVTIIGARPQFIKMALVSKALKDRSVKEVIIHTGQHYSKNMSGIFFRELKIRKPDYDLGVGSGSHAAQLARMLIGIEGVLKKERPDIVMIYGDTNSTLAGALAAAKLNIRIAHVEAGLRSNNFDIPEEVNRVMVDSVSSIFLCPTRDGVDNLKKEGKVRGVYLVGDVMYDSVKKCMDKIKSSRYESRYALCTIHRAENTDDARSLKNIFKALGKIRENIIMPLHPRTAKYIKKYRVTIAPNIKVIDPVCYSEMLSLEKGASVIITDSGGVQKESLILGIPCVTLRNETEWVETVKSGVNRIVGTDPRKIVSAVSAMRRSKKRVSPERFYGDGRAHERIADIIKKELRA